MRFITAIKGGSIHHNWKNAYGLQKNLDQERGASSRPPRQNPDQHLQVWVKKVKLLNIYLDYEWFHLKSIGILGAQSHFSGNYGHGHSYCKVQSLSFFSYSTVTAHVHAPPQR